MEINFGTDGWRGLIADTFTFQNVRKVSSALAHYLNSRKKKDQHVVIGYDNRFLSERFAAESSKALILNGIPVLISRTPLPTAALSYQVLHAKASCGIMITASHNPPEYNGFKLKADFGGSALPDMTDAIQSLTAEMEEVDPTPFVHPLPKEIKRDFLSPYLEHLKKFVDLELIKSSTKSCIVDSMYGVGGDIIENLLSGGKCRISTIHNKRDPYFGGIPPEPMPTNLKELSEEVKNGSFDLGLATDGDADRIGAISDDGSFASSLTVTPLLALHLINNKKQRGEIAKTFAQTITLDRIARKYSFPMHIRPIGFKYIAELMLHRDILIGGEESGGISIKGYFPERDGLLIGLLLLEMLCQMNRSFTELKKQMWRDYGRMEYGRIDIKSIPESGKKWTDYLVQNSPKNIGEFPVQAIDPLDGIKFILSDESWLLLRQSGTEPVLRIYSEAPTREKLDTLLKTGQELASAGV
jgi:phosphomannomutase